MLNTFTSYSLIAKDIPKALDRVESEPVVDHATKYYLDNITKVKSIDDFVKNDRLFSYAMKAHGLEDMTYAKAFMVKVLKEGIKDSNSFANQLTDKRYADFAASFNFEAYGDKATVYNKAQVDVPANYATQAAIAGVDPNSASVTAETTYYSANITKVTSVDGLMGNARLVTYVLASVGIDDTDDNKALLRKSLDGGVADASSFANTLTDKRYLAIATTFDFKGLGENATTVSAAQRPEVDKYVRQTLEEEEGQKNEGVRLALNFQRKASGGDITNFYDVLADKALASVVRTALGLPDSFASANIDQQAKLFESKLDIADFTDPVKLDKFLKRFTSLWELQNPTQSAQTSVSVLFSQSAAYGISADTLFSIAKLGR